MLPHTVLLLVQLPPGVRGVGVSVLVGWSTFEWQSADKGEQQQQQQHRQKAKVG